MVKQMKMKLIHYGHSHFDSTLWCQPTEDYFKPKGGLWTSPINSEYSWKHWCEAEGFRLNHLQPSFELEIEGNIYVVEGDSGSLALDQLKRWRIDAIYLPLDQIHNKCFWGWDCETVLILNKDCIK